MSVPPSTADKSNASNTVTIVVKTLYGDRRYWIRKLRITVRNRSIVGAEFTAAWDREPMMDATITPEIKPTWTESLNG